MAREAKVRPTFSVRELDLMAQALEYKVNAHIQAKDYSNPIILDCNRLITYCRSFGAVESAEQQLAKYIAAFQAANGGVNVNFPLVPAEGNTDIEPLKLTDDQRYDLLKLRPESTYSDEDKVFMLNTGTLIMMRRAGVTSVSEDDL